MKATRAMRGSSAMALSARWPQGDAFFAFQVEVR